MNRGKSIDGIPYFDEVEHVDFKELDRIMEACKSKNSIKENIMKVFISMPMNGRDNSEIKEQMESLMRKFEDSNTDDFSLLENNSAELIDSVLDLGDKPGLFYLGASLKLMSEANVVIMAKGWDSARGCIIEEAAAEAYKINTVYETDIGFSDKPGEKEDN